VVAPGYARSDGRGAQVSSRRLLRKLSVARDDASHREYVLFVLRDDFITLAGRRAMLWATKWRRPGFHGRSEKDARSFRSHPAVRRCLLCEFVELVGKVGQLVRDCLGREGRDRSAHRPLLEAQAGLTLAHDRDRRLP
jgi:hypothetical protein